MKTFWKALIVIATTFAIIGCSGGGGGGGSSEVPIGAITVKLNGQPLPADGLTINVGQTVTLTAEAAGAESFSLSQNNTYYSRSGLALTGTDATPANGITVTVNAANASGGSGSTSFNLKVLPKLTGFSVKWENTVLDDAAQGNPFGLATGYDYPLSIATVPVAAENNFEWVSSDTTQLTITEDPQQPGVRIIKAPAGISTPVSVTVTPAQAGLNAGEVAARELWFIADSSYATPVGSLAINKQPDGTPISSSITVKRGRSITVVAVPDVTNGTTVEWDFSGSAVTKEENGFEATFTATENDAGGNVTITAKARNMFNTVDVPQTFTIQVPARGNVIFEWIADENPEEGNLLNAHVRNYPGFRNVYIGAIGAANNTVQNIPFNGTDFTGMKVGRHANDETISNPRLVIGTAVVDTDGTEEGKRVKVTSTAGSSAVTGMGTLDLSKPVKLTLTYQAVEMSGWMRITVNNNWNGNSDSNLGQAGQVKHFTSTTVFNDNRSSVLNTYETIIDFSSSDMYYPRTGNDATFTAWGNLNEFQKNELKTAFIGIVPQNNGVTYINLTGIKIEQINVADIEIGQEADFAGFPTATFTVNSSVNKSITLSGAGYTSADWYIDGVKVSPTGTLTYTVTKGTLATGEHSLTAIISVGGHVYSKTVKFTVE